MRQGMSGLTKCWRTQVQRTHPDLNLGCLRLAYSIGKKIPSIDLEKAYDKIPRIIMWWALDKHKVPTKYVGLIKDMYNNVVTSVRTSDGDTDDFTIRIGLHQGSALTLTIN